MSAEKNRSSICSAFTAHRAYTRSYDERRDARARAPSGTYRLGAAHEVRVGSVASAAAVAATVAIPTTAVTTSASATTAVSTATAATTAVSTATAAVSATATTTTTATTEATTATTTATTGTRLSLFGLVDAQRPAFEYGAVHLLNRRLRKLRIAHGHEAEASRLTGRAIHHDVDIGDFANLGERSAQDVLRGVEGQIAHVKSIAHRDVFSGSRSGGDHDGTSPSALSG
jgi:hypothetical protein